MYAKPSRVSIRRVASTRDFESSADARFYQRRLFSSSKNYKKMKNKLNWD